MFLYGLLLIVLGVLAVPNLILAKRPDAKKVLDKITPFQGWIGIAAFVWGIWLLISWLLGSFGLLGLGVKGIIWFLIIVATILCYLALGALLGVGVAKTFVKDPNAQAKMDEVVAKVAPKQGALGILALIVGAIVFLNSFIHFLY
ncbi:MAG TPA: hypothetical protein VKE22_29400 [Haliangiales bacterium]|nr:hypothetical protein [Haliangiales bacterium]